MSDIYSGGGDVAPQNQGRGPQYRGMRRRRVNPQTGQEEVEVWVQGQGYLPEGSIASLAQEDQAQLARARGLLGTARTNARLADRFTAINARAPTGGLSALPVPTLLQSPDRQRLEGITNQMVRANIQPGQAGTMNSIIEQMLARQQYPTTDTYGPVNGDRALQLAVDEEEILRMVDEAEAWAREHRGLQGFDVHWTRNRSDQVRRDAEQRIRQDPTRPYRPRRSGQRERDTPRIRIDANGNPIR